MNHNHAFKRSYYTTRDTKKALFFGWHPSLEMLSQQSPNCHFSNCPSGEKTYFF